LLFLAACSKPSTEPATQGQAEDEQDSVSAPAPAAEPTKEFDYPKMAQGMMALLSERPECQRFRDELQAMIDAPGGTKPPRDPSYVVAEAHDARCSKKSEQQ
jgi:hypothetical protein